MFWPEGLDEAIAGALRWLKLLLVFAAGFGVGALAYCGHGPAEVTPEPTAQIWTTP